VFKDRNLVKICVVDIATGMYEAGKCVGVRISAPPEGPRQHPPSFFYSRYQTCSSEDEGIGAWCWPTLLTSGSEWGIQLPRLKKELG